MSTLFDRISAIAPVTSTQKKTYTATPAQKFIKAAKSEIAAIQNGDKSGKWFVKNDDRFTLKFRNGNQVIELAPGQKEVHPTNASVAVEVIQIVIEECLKGSLDEQFEAQKITRKVNV